jgi:hypothetical protein
MREEAYPVRRNDPPGHATVKLPAEWRSVTATGAMGPARNVGATGRQAHRTTGSHHSNRGPAQQ